jgi:hypothetical protein
MKARAALAIVGHRPVKPSGLVTACSVLSPQSEIAVVVARAIDVPVTVIVPSLNESSWGDHLRRAAASGATVRRARVGWNTVLAAEARATALAEGLVEIPFGMFSPVAVEQARLQAVNIPSEVKTIVIPAGSGVTMAGVAQSVDRTRVRLIGVAVGTDPRRPGEKFGWGRYGGCPEVIEPVGAYHEKATVSGPVPVPMHPLYEAKAWNWVWANWNSLSKPVLFWIVGAGPA